MKNNVSKIILILSDVLIIFLSISLAYTLREALEGELSTLTSTYEQYIKNIFVYLIVIVTFFNEKIYKYRFDFWQETRLVLRALTVSLVLLLSMLALTQTVEEYSRVIIVISFLIMGLCIPISKNILKKFLFRVGLWRRESEIVGSDISVHEEVFKNPYLGYVFSDHTQAQTIFIDTNKISADELQKRLHSSLQEKKEVLFIPLLQSFNFSNARIVELTNARKNLIVVENALFKKSNIMIKKVSDLFLSLLLLPVFILFFLIIVILIKKEEPKGSIFFKQKRMGRDGKKFVCYKFRSMYENGDEILKRHLQEYPDEISYYAKFHKYKQDPRITRIGHLMRKTSLDELPQIINVVKGEMSLIGPRPYMLNEEKKLNGYVDIIQAVKPGITGLWQVSGRSDVDFNSRVEIDVWYTRNWNLWLDLVILVKTVKVVLLRKGAS